MDISQGSFIFPWYVANGGYTLEDSLAYAPGLNPQPAEKDIRSPWLIPCDGSSRTYGTLSHHTLHRKFAQIVGKREKVLEFANEYGFLGRIGIDLAPPEGGNLITGESLARWEQEAVDLGLIITIWDAVRWDSKERLEQIIRWSEKGVQLATWWDFREGRYSLFPGSKYRTMQEFMDLRAAGPYCGGTFTWLAGTNPNINTNLLKRWNTGDVIEPARYYVCHEINKKLSNHAHPQIMPFRNNEVVIVPDSLLTAFWLLLLWEVAGEIRMLLCPGCNRIVEQKHGGQRYCSNACRQIAYRERREHI